MEPQDAVDLGRRAVVETLLIGSPVLIAGMIVGLIVGLIQALTQVQEQTIAFVPKIFAMIAVLGYALPWLITRMLEYSHDLISSIPEGL
jgi:flagellar biosynthetic protein FliQ